MAALMVTCAGMKEIQRPDIERAAGEIDAGGSFGFDNHAGPWNGLSKVD